MSTIYPVGWVSPIIEARRESDAVLKEEAKLEPIIAYLLDHTAQEIKDRINTDVTDLASAKQMLGRFGVALAYLARQGLR